MRRGEGVCTYISPEEKEIACLCLALFLTVMRRSRRVAHDLLTCPTILTCLLYLLQILITRQAEMLL